MFSGKIKKYIKIIDIPKHCFALRLYFCTTNIRAKPFLKGRVLTTNSFVANFVGELIISSRLSCFFVH